MKQLTDKVIIVTGGSGLLGKAIVTELNNKGAIVLNFDINGLTDLSINFVECDITNEESIHPYNCTSYTKSDSWPYSL